MNPNLTTFLGIVTLKKRKGLVDLRLKQTLIRLWKRLTHVHRWQRKYHIHGHFYDYTCLDCGKIKKD